VGLYLYILCLRIFSVEKQWPKLEYIPEVEFTAIRLPITSFDLPPDLLGFLDELVRNDIARNRRETVVRALQAYIKFQIHKWNGPFIIINGIRRGLISKGSLAELTCEMSHKQMFVAGTRMGKALHDLAKGRRLDISKPENYKSALQILEDFGWGRFDIEGNRITIVEPLFPAAVMRGYLESALAIKLKELSSVEEIQFFEIMRIRHMKGNPLIRKRAHVNKNIGEDSGIMGFEKPVEKKVNDLLTS